MRELENQEIKVILLNIVKEIDEICRSNEIEYSIAYGTLLGAVRHGGFIPWDDDLDILMRREDYDKFVNYCRLNKTAFSIKEYSDQKEYNYTYCKVCDNDTVLVEKYIKTCEMGAYIDVFPIDYLSNDYSKSVSLFNKQRFNRSLITASNWKKFYRNKNKSIWREPFRFSFYLLSKLVNVKNIIKKVIGYYSNNKVAKYSANSVDGTWGKRNVMESNIFEEYCDINFENLTLRGIKKSHEFLTNIYGDYMTLPPVEKRKTHHDFSVYRIDEKE